MKSFRDTEGCSHMQEELDLKLLNPLKWDYTFSFVHIRRTMQKKGGKSKNSVENFFLIRLKCDLNERKKICD